MLVLTRKKNQTLKIGRDVEVTVVRIAGNQVRIGITCPETMNVKRGELDNPLPGDEEPIPAAA